MDRRRFLKTIAISAAGALLAKSLPKTLMAYGGEPEHTAAANIVSTVYMTKTISPESLSAAYAALGRGMKGKVAVKLSMGEPGGHNYLAPDLVKSLVKSVNGTFVDSNTAYNGKRAIVADHMQAARDHGFLAVAPVDILDAEGEIRLPVAGGKHLRDVRVGSHFSAYGSFLVLSHFKGHAMGGFGGALKNIAIGIASRSGKCLVHTAGASDTNAFAAVEQDHFLESMAEAAEGMIRAAGPENMLYINVMNNLSIDCDCDSNPSAPEIRDIGILASHDPVAIDQASVDLIYAADPKESASLRRRMEEKNGVHILAHAEKLGIGNRKYTLVNIDA